MIPYRTIGASVGRCNICGAFGPLTDDHVPPKGCVEPRLGRIGHIGERRSRIDEIRGVKVNHGVIYRTLCEDCNSRILGGEYDPVLIEFSRNVRELADIPLFMPSTSSIATKPQRLARAVLGHLLAVGVDRFDAGEAAEGIRQYFLDPLEQMPDKLKLYYWVYKGQERVLVRDAGILTLGSRGHSFFWLMKFCPLAFMMIWDGQLQVPGLRNFDSAHGLAIDQSANLLVDFHPLPGEFFPELPGEEDVLLYGRDSVVCVDR